MHRATVGLHGLNAAYTSDEGSSEIIDWVIVKVLRIFSIMPDKKVNVQATTAAMQHSLSLGKRSNSEANLTVPSQNKMPRMR